MTNVKCLWVCLSDIITAVSCGSVPTPGSNSALQSSTGTSQSDTATYACNTGHTTGAAMTLTCQSDGTWKPATAPDCTDRLSFSSVICVQTIKVPISPTTSA